MGRGRRDEFLFRGGAQLPRDLTRCPWNIPPRRAPLMNRRRFLLAAVLFAILFRRSSPPQRSRIPEQTDSRSSPGRQRARADADAEDPNGQSFSRSHQAITTYRRSCHEERSERRPNRPLPLRDGSWHSRTKPSGFIHLMADPSCEWRELHAPARDRLHSVRAVGRAERSTRDGARL